jgi:hypothetical protein
MNARQKIIRAPGLQSPMSAAQANSPEQEETFSTSIERLWK